MSCEQCSCVGPAPQLHCVMLIPITFFYFQNCLSRLDVWGAPRTGGVVNGGHMKFSITVVGDWSPYNCSLVTSKMSFF